MATAGGLEQGLVRSGTTRVRAVAAGALLVIAAGAFAVGRATVDNPAGAAVGQPVSSVVSWMLQPIQCRVQHSC